MPTTIEAYTFAELTDEKAKEKARAWMRESNNEDSWVAEQISESMKERLAEEGLPEDVQWSLYSQGSGVAFDGPVDLLKYTTFHKLREWGAVEEFYGVRIKDEGTHYHHERTMSVELEEFDNYSTDGHPQAFWVTQFGTKLEEHLKERIVAVSLELREMAENEYEYRDSNECIDADLEANEYLFTTEGRRLPV
jgi:hypothetical protein